MQAIHTKYLSCTNNRPPRIKASAGAGTIIVSLHSTIDGIDLDSVSLVKATMLVAKQFAKKFKWEGKWVMGTLANGDNVFVNDVHEFESFNVEREVR